MSQRDVELSMISELTKERGASFLHGNFAANITPIMVSDFISEFAKKVNPKSIIDPAAGIGSLIRIVSDCLGNKSKITAVEINPPSFEKLKELSKGFPIECIKGDCLEEIDRIKGDFDLAIGDLPWGIPIHKVGSTSKYKGVRTVGGAIILKVLERLNKGGYALFTSPNSFFLEYDKIKEHIKNSGAYLAGVIKIPAGTYYPLTSIATNIFIFKKDKDVDEAFVGTLDSDNAPSLVNSFFSGKSAFSGKFVSESKVKMLSWNSVKAQDYIDSLVSKKKIKKIQGIKVLSKLDLTEPNSVFITTVYAPKIKLSLSEKEQKGKYIQLVLPKEYDREVFAFYYNSKFGAKIFSTVTAGNFLGSLSYGKAKELDYYYPTSSGAGKVKIISKRIQQIKESLDLQSKLLDENIIDNLESVYNEISKIELLTDIDYLMKLFPTIIVKPYTEYVDLKKNEDYLKAFETLYNLTIALFMLGISVMWGGLKTNESMFNDMKETIIKSVKRFGVLSLGDMVNMYASFAKVIRTQTSQKEGADIILEAFGIRSQSTIDGMLDKDIISIGSICGEIRNRKLGHKGATSREDDKRHLELLEKSVFELISKFEWLKNIKIFLYGGKLHVQNDGTLKVSGTIFNGLVPHSGDLLVDKPLKDETLYFSFDELGKAIELPGLIRYGESNNDKNKVAYVYSRVNSFDKTQLDYLSYESYEEEKAYSVSEVTDDLFMTLLNNSQRV